MISHVYLHEQDNAFREVLTYCLAQEGWEVVAFPTGYQALSHVADRPDLWIIDTDDEQGFKVIREIKKEAGNTIPIIATSERERVINRVLGLELGCADFVVKAFLPQELILRIRRILGEKKQHGQECQTKGEMLQDYFIDPLRRVVSINGENIDLTSKEFELLALFMQYRDMALSREQIIRSVWGENYFGSDRVVDDLIRRIRKKVKHLKVETLYGFGYLVTS